MLTDWFRQCRLCHSIYPPIDYLCESCWEREMYKKKHLLFSQEFIEEIFVYSLFQWRGEWPFLKNLVYDFKYSGLQSMSDRLVEYALIHLIQSSYWEFPDYIVYPTKSDNHRDHGLLLARSFSRWLGRPILPLQLREQKFHYRSLSRKERREGRAFQPLQKTLPKASILFVDDVVTTGATVRGAKRALKHNKLQVFSLVFRGLN